MEETTAGSGAREPFKIRFAGLHVFSVWSAGHRQDIYTLCLTHKSRHMAERTDTA